MKTLRISSLLLLLVSPQLFSQWSSQASPTTTYLYDVQFVGSQTGYVVIGGGQLLRTANGGAQWLMQSFGSGISIAKMKFISTSVGWGVGSTSGKRGVILKTVDGGATWAVQDSSFQQVYPQSICFVDPLHGWVTSMAASLADTAGRMYRTVNGGTSWLPVNAPNIAWPNDIFFVDTLTGYAVGEFGAVVKSNDGGITWREIYRASHRFSSTSTVLEPLRRILFADKNNGWAVGGISGVETKVRTTDGGTTWLISTFTGGASLHGLAFTDSLNGWTVGGVVGGPTIEHTTDGGATWGKQTHPFASHMSLVFWAVCMTSATEGWVVGDSGKILRTTNGGGSVQVSGIIDRSNGVPEAFNLSQNYPNPFNPTTAISYQLVTNGFITIKIYDQLGREVAMLVNEMGTAGMHSVRWDGKNNRGESVSSGIYLYELRAGTSVMTRKMVLLK